MAKTVESTIPSIAPRQPACADATTPAIGSASKTGAQSAARVPNTIPDFLVTSASALGNSLPRGLSIITAVAE